VGDLVAAASNFSLCQLESIVGQGWWRRKINVGPAQASALAGGLCSQYRNEREPGPRRGSPAGVVDAAHAGGKFVLKVLQLAAYE
jgi:hypothetical protein